MSKNTLALIRKKDVRWVDLRFTDTIGKEQHVTIPSKNVNENFFSNGHMFDGSSIIGWKSKAKNAKRSFASTLSENLIFVAKLRFAQPFLANFKWTTYFSLFFQEINENYLFLF